MRPEEKAAQALVSRFSSPCAHLLESIASVAMEYVNPSQLMLNPRRTAQIEERLNGLVSLLQASGELPPQSQGQQQDGSTPGDYDESNITSSQMTESPIASNPAPVQSQQTAKEWFIPATYNSFGAANCICRPAPGDAPPPPETDDVALEIYRTQLQQLYPFVVIPPSITAAQLGVARPFLMSAIRMVTSFRSLRSMRAQMYALKMHISDFMLIRSERSMDLLQGIIVILGWYQYHCFTHAQLHNLLSLAISLIGEMGLNRHPIIHEGTRLMAAQPPAPLVRNSDERRAFLGVWFLASSMSTVFGRIEPMRYTSYVRECVTILEKNMEYQTDVNLVFLLRIQHLTQRISELNPRDNTIEEFTSIPKAPTAVYISAFQSELDELRASLPEHLRNDNIITMYFNTARLRLYEPPVVDRNLIASLADAFTMNNTGGGTPLDRLYNTSAALTGWFETWFVVPVSQYALQPTAVGAQLVYALTMLGRWAQLVAPKPVGEPEDTQRGTTGLPSFEPKPQNAQGTAASPQTVDHGVIPPRLPCPLAPAEIDPDLPAAVAHLRAQLKTHPGLMVNVGEILLAICNRFEQTNATFQISSTDSRKDEANVWSMTALRVRITKAKLERWAELVSKEGENHSPGQQLKADMDTSMSGWNAGPSSAPASGMMQTDGGAWQGMDSNVPADQMQNVYGSTPWRSDLLTGVDPAVWFDGYLDWGAVIMNSMGTVEQ
ncbi:hypothetical protein ISF_05131 [Cordyceps fumosorosea ARSEF 2679]|uniref:Xylanolytic transcriptional activator regulatory domain-containing protein n=1 Tax=Cordyceps fumosorosea (strain ARSEF 2679) TaxID=1081104 RepID=A0A167V1G9_CORFA|nr:hypothetical protein ISF_05131 [Cordyceps fumosorosea ARSEF 2679]OAA62122.1 hypothetical protein ISF_05131 [Cordyceps fumosorosea ARSEF 2679]